MLIKAENLVKTGVDRALQSAEERYEAAAAGITDHHDAAYERELFEQGALRRRANERAARRAAARGGGADYGLSP